MSTSAFGDVIAVNDLNLQIADKEFLVLVGPSGCGKTTSLRLLAGLEEISDGRILIGDRVVNDVPPKDRDIAMVFQSYALYPHMSVYDNMAFGLKLRKTPKARSTAVKEAAEILGIGQCSTASRSSSPAVSASAWPSVAPSCASRRSSSSTSRSRTWTPSCASQTRAEISKLHQRLGTTFIYVTHDQVEAMTMASRIAVMKDGLLQQIDSPQNLYDHPATSSWPASSAALDELLRATLVDQDGKLYVDGGTFKPGPCPRARRLPTCSTRARRSSSASVPRTSTPRATRRPASRMRPSSQVDVSELMGNEIFLYLLSGQEAVHRSC
jgi:multiple sugar transport system ATP-binding protein